MKQAFLSCHPNHHIPVCIAFHFFLVGRTTKSPVIGLVTVSCLLQTRLLFVQVVKSMQYFPSPLATNKTIVCTSCQVNAILSLSSCYKQDYCLYKLSSQCNTFPLLLLQTRLLFVQVVKSMQYFPSPLATNKTIVCTSCQVSAILSLSSCYKQDYCLYKLSSQCNTFPLLLLQTRLLFVQVVKSMQYSPSPLATNKTIVCTSCQVSQYFPSPLATNKTIVCTSCQVSAILSLSSCYKQDYCLYKLSSQCNTLPLLLLQTRLLFVQVVKSMQYSPSPLATNKTIVCTSCQVNAILSLSSCYKQDYCLYKLSSQCNTFPLLLLQTRLLFVQVVKSMQYSPSPLATNKTIVCTSCQVNAIPSLSSCYKQDYCLYKLSSQCNTFPLLLLQTRLLFVQVVKSMQYSPSPLALQR